MIFRLILATLLLAASTEVFGWNDKITHKTITEYAAKFHFTPIDANFLGLPIKGLRALEWIKMGSELEDSGDLIQFANGRARSLNHFHAPNRPLAEAGLTDIKTGISAIRWAQDGPHQIGKGSEDWSWQAVRSHYYDYLTAPTQSVKDDCQVKLLKGLGYQMHLIQDMSQPNHVRNDTHVFDGAGITNGLETWAKSHDDIISNKILATTPIPKVTVDLTVPFEDPSKVPMARLSDTRSYASSQTPSTSLSQGLAEYTNANFFSEDTVFAEGLSADDKHYFPAPRKQETNLQAFVDNILNTAPTTDVDGKTYQSFVISKRNTSGEKLDCLARPGPNTRKYFQEFGEGEEFTRSFVVDETCFEEYARHLIPRAVGYSVAMLTYFHRGTIELTLPDSGVYSVTDPFDFELKEVRVKAKNTTSTGELMSNGQIKLVVRYRLALEDPFRSEPVDIEPEYRYIVVPEKTGRTSIPKDAPVELVFDLSATPIPLWATNLYLQVVYRGQLGAEADAVAVGLKDISEPTPVDLYNNTDYTCINGTWLSSGSPAAVAAVDTNNDGIADLSDVYPHTISYVYANISPVGSTVPASPTAFDIYEDYPSLPGGLLRIGFVLSDYAFSYGVHEKWLKRDPNDTWDVIDKDHQYPGTAVMNQTGPDDIDYYPYMYNMRGRKMWWGAGVIYDNNEYPSGSSCSWDDM